MFEVIVFAGIGYWTALDLAKRGARVILACRDKERGETARNAIVKTTNNENVVLKHLDLSDFDSVKSFADEINKNESYIHILVNNAAVIGANLKLSKHGLDLQMQVNYVSVVFLTVLLLGKCCGRLSWRKRNLLIL